MGIYRSLTTLMVLFASSICLLVGAINGAMIGALLVNSLTEYFTAGQITRMILYLAASLGFSVGAAGLGNIAVPALPMISLVGGGWLGFALSGEQLDPIVAIRGAEIWQGIGVSDAAPFVPGWLNDRTAGFLSITLGAVAASYGLGLSARLLTFWMLERSIRRMVHADGMVLVDESYGVRTYVHQDTDNPTVIRTNINLDDKDKDDL